MTSTKRTLRALGAVDVVSGLVLVAAAGWFADQLDLGAATVRIAGGVLAVVGVDTILLAGRSFMAKVGIAAEAITALVAVDVLALADPTGTGAVILVATAASCAAAALWLTGLRRSPELVTAA